MSNGSAPPLRFVLRAPVSAPEQRSIAIANAPSGCDLLTGPDGQPVWPLENEEAATALREIATVFQGKLIEVQARERFQRFPEDAELVVGIGDVEAETRLYAHLSSRSYKMVETADQISVQPPLVVVVCCGPTVPADVICRLLPALDRNHVVGVIWGRNRAELKKRALVASCAAHLNTPATRGPVMRVMGPRGHAPEEPRSLGELRKILGMGAGALVLYGHSDGVALELPARAALCAWVDGEAGDVNRAPECYHSGACRLGVSVETARSEGRLISPEVLAGRVVVATGCQFLFLGNHAVDQTWSSVSRTAVNPRIGALVVSPELFARMPAILERDLIDGLAKGASVGTALASYCNNKVVSTFGGRLLLFGDPRVRATSSAAPPKLVAQTQDSPSPGISHQALNAAGGSHVEEPPPDSESNTGSQLELLRLVTKVLRPETRETSKETVDAVLRQARRYESSAAGPLHAEAGRELRRAVLSHLAIVKARVLEVWSPYFAYAERGPRIDCPNCGLGGQILIARLPAGITREAFKCLACGEVTDYQVEDGRRPVVDLPHISLKGTGDGRNWDGAVFLLRTKVTDTVMLPWPSRSNGEPQLQFSIAPEMNFNGPIRVAAVFLDGLALNAMSAVTAGRDE